MDDTTFRKLSGINDALIEHLRWLVDKKDLAALSALVPIVDKLTTVLLEIRRPETSA